MVSPIDPRGMGNQDLPQTTRRGLFEKGSHPFAPPHGTRHTVLPCLMPTAGLTTFVPLAKAQLMNKTTSRRPRWATMLALVAILFGIVTIIVGGKTLFGSAEERAAAGNIVPFVLWFNFVAGFAYVIAGLGLFLWKRWAAQLSAVIAVATIAVFIAFGIHVFLGGAFEVRTVGAMAIRSAVWIVIAALACRSLRCSP